MINHALVPKILLHKIMKVGEPAFLSRMDRLSLKGHQDMKRMLLTKKKIYRDIRARQESVSSRYLLSVTLFRSVQSRTQVERAECSDDGGGLSIPIKVEG